MGDDSSGSLEGKSLSNMRVVDLKIQLEKRGLSKSGSKKELVKRLKQKLELEKLYEESAADGDSEPKLHLDEATEQNEFVKQYLAQQQEIYARQKEVKRLIELKEQQQLDEEETDSDACNKDQDSDVSESVSVAKNSCDSSTHAEGGEEETKLSEEQDDCSQAVESSTEGDPVTQSSKIDPIDQSESSHSQSSMDSPNPDSAVSYSLSDIRLPDSPRKLLSKVVLKAKGNDGEAETIEEPSEQKDAVETDVGKKSSMETNGTADVEDVNRNSDADEASNLSRKSVSPNREIVTEHVKVEVSVPKEKELESMDDDSCANKIPTEVLPPEELKFESHDDEMVAEKMEDVREVSDCQDPREAESSQADSGDASRHEAEKVESSKKGEVEDGETDVDSDSDSAPVRTKRKRQDSVEGRTRKLSREESCESSKSQRSSSRECSAKETRSSSREHSSREARSSSSDSSSSEESIPKRRSRHHSVSHAAAKESTVADNISHQSHRDELLSELRASALRLEGSADKPRRVKIKRSSVIPPTEPHPKADAVGPPPKKETSRWHKKVEPPKDESKPSHSTTSSEPEVKASKKEHSPKKRVAEDPPPAEAIPPPKVSYRKLNVPFKRSEESKEKLDKKRSWNSIPALSKIGVSISTDSLKSLIPDFKVLCSPSVLSESEEKSMKLSLEQPSNNKQRTVVHSGELSNPSPVTIEKTVGEEPKKPKHRESTKEIPVEPMEVEEHPRRTVLSSEKPCTNMLFIRNLVRPFTLLQLKEVLKQTGTVVEEGFWIDKIKSKCLVTYENEEQAAKTRESLHNSRWPASNPKILSVEFVTKEEFDMYKNDGEEPKQPVPAALLPPLKQSPHPPIAEASKKEREEKDHLKERERQRKAMIYMREWDKDKLTQDSPERDRHGSSRSVERSRSFDKEKDRRGRADSTKDSSRDEHELRKRQEEDTPAKLLDDLFQKTKTTPCIYWLPLTEEQVKQKEEERRLRRLEREKRNQEQEEAERATRRKPREKNSRSRTRSPARRR